MSHSATLDMARAALMLCTSLLGAVAIGQDSKVADGVTIYLGVVPAEVVLGHPAEHPEGGMHKGGPAGPGSISCHGRVV